MAGCRVFRDIKGDGPRGSPCCAGPRDGPMHDSIAGQCPCETEIAKNHPQAGIVPAPGYLLLSVDQLHAQGFSFITSCPKVGRRWLGYQSVLQKDEDHDLAARPELQRFAGRFSPWLMRWRITWAIRFYANLFRTVF